MPPDAHTGTPTAPGRGPFATALVMAAAVVLSLVLGLVPLLDGLTYEYGVVVALVSFAAAIAGGSSAAIGYGTPYRLRWKLLERTPAERVDPGLWRWARLLTTGVVTAGVIPTWRGYVADCVWESGIVPYFFVTLPAIPLGLGIGVLARTHAPSSRPRRLGLVAAMVLAIAALTIWEILAGPRAVFHNLILGVLSNTAYLGLDESVRIGPSAILQRVSTLALAALLLALSRHRAVVRAKRSAATNDDLARADLLLDVERRGARARVLVASALVLGMIGVGDPFGFGSGRRTLEARLSGRHETPHFELRYRPGSRVEPLLPALADDTEWAYRRRVAVLGLVPDPTRRITAFVYADAKEQLELTGASGYLFAKPWLGEIHTQLDDRGELAALDHELVHVLAARFGLPFLRVSIRYGLIEGLAEAVAADYAERDWRHESSAAALRLGLLPRAGDVISSLGFATRDAGTSYVAAASFCGFLLKRYGAEPLRSVYAWGDFARSYGRSLDELDREWRHFLSAMKVSRRALARSSRAFDREQSPPFFRRLCARLGIRTGPPSPAKEAGSAAWEAAFAELDRRAATGPELERDATLAAMVAMSARANRLDLAGWVLARRADLDLARAEALAAMRQAPDDGPLLAAIIELTSGESLAGEASVAGPVITLARALARGTTVTSLVASARAIGGCAPGLEAIEARLLLAVARVARRAALVDDAHSLASTARALGAHDEELVADAEDELVRLATHFESLKYR